MQVVLDLWLALWPAVFQPALGILMAGAVRIFRPLWLSFACPCPLVGVGGQCSNLWLCLFAAAVWTGGLAAIRHPQSEVSGPAHSACQYSTLRWQLEQANGAPAAIAKILAPAMGRSLWRVLEHSSSVSGAMMLQHEMAFSPIGQAL
jgi:hypothetical protein